MENIEGAGIGESKGVKRGQKWEGAGKEKERGGRPPCVSQDESVAGSQAHRLESRACT